MARRTILISLICIVVGVSAGVGSALYQIRQTSSAFGSAVTVNGWSTSPTIGSAASNPIERAVVAVKGLLALARKETVYFSRAADQSGAPLRENCLYSITGNRTAPQARWWSITLYAADNYLAVNGDEAGSVDVTRIFADADGAYEVVISPVRGTAKNWLSSKNAGDFTLSMRLYNPDQTVQTALSTASLPTVKLVSCTGAKT